MNGDGTLQVTDWAGKPWAKGTPLDEFITHRYDDADQSVRPRVDTTWTAQYRVDGGAWQDVGGTVTIPAIRSTWPCCRRSRTSGRLDRC